QYYDSTLDVRVDEVRAALQAELETIEDGVMGAYGAELDALREEHETLRVNFAAQMEGYRERLQGVWQAVRRDLRESLPDLRDFAVPQADEAAEIGEGLYNSQRDYLEQIAAYKAFQGKVLVEG